MKKIVHFLSLFGSLSTLLCCALPVLLVSLGMGATFASLTAAVPQIHWITEHKTWLFIVTGILLAISYFLMRYSRYSQDQSCPIEEGPRQACQSAKPAAKWIFRLSVALYGIGALFSYVIPWIMYGPS